MPDTPITSAGMPEGQKFLYRAAIMMAHEMSSVTQAARPSAMVGKRNRLWKTAATEQSTQAYSIISEIIKNARAALKKESNWLQ